jgi:protein-tyrosine-phosphatase
MSETKHVLFVCTGNTCRSPIAEGLFRKAVLDRTDYKVSSAGISATKGTPANSETDILLKKRNAELDDFRSRRVTDKILTQATHVFAMTRNHLEILESHFPNYADKFYLACEFTKHSKNRAVPDVPDPIGMGRAAYEEVANVLESAIPTIIAYIDQTWKP